MSDLQVGAELATPVKHVLTSVHQPQALDLVLTVADVDSVAELTLRREGRDREDYALCALRIGLLSLKHARGQVDADAVKREGDRLLENLNGALASYREQIHEGLTLSLKEYFDPTSGKFHERIERLVKKDGELEQVLRKQLGPEGSELSVTLSAYVGEQSPLFKLLDPEESEGLVSVASTAIQELLDAERERVLSEFSLDKKDSALSRLVSELAEKNGRLQQDLAHEVEGVVAEFSLDDENSALSRLVRRIEQARELIADEFSLDKEGSALSRMSQMLNTATDAINNNLTLDKEESALARLRREIVGILEKHEKQATDFQGEVKSALEAMKARRQESLRSTIHGIEFQDIVIEFVEKEALRTGDLPTRTANNTGEIKFSKVGDAVVTLGSDCLAAGETFVIEAKEDASYDLGKAREEIDRARSNRRASVGLFIFSKLTAPKGQEPLLRDGDDVFVVWDAADVASDVFLKAGVSLAKALCVRRTKTREAEKGDFDSIDKAILAVEAEAKRLSSMKTLTETIHSNSEKVLGEIRKMSAALVKQLDALREGIAGLKQIAPK